MSAFFEKLPQVAKPMNPIRRWWRRVTGRDRYVTACDYASGPDHWVKVVIDTKTGVITILDIGVK